LNFNFISLASFGLKIEKSLKRYDYTAFVFFNFITKIFGQNILLKIFFKDGIWYYFFKHRLAKVNFPLTNKLKN
jgi:hypothetical protein